jgi:hypothetical protein
MTDEMDQNRAIVFIQSLPDDQLRELRRAITKEMKRRGLTQGGDDARTEGGGRKRGRAGRSGDPEE